MRAAKPHGHAEPLSAAHGDIGIHRARFLEHGQRHEIGGHDSDGAGLMQGRDLGREVLHAAKCARVLENRAKDFRRIERAWIRHDHLDPQRRGAGLHHLDILRMAVFIDEKPGGFGFGQALCHGHRLCAGRRLIQKRRVRHRQAGHIGHHGLKVQQRLQTALRDLRLIGRIGRVPGGVFQDIALDRGRGRRAVIAHTDERGHSHVLRPDFAHMAEHLMFGHRRPCEGRGLADRHGHGLINQRIQRRLANHLEHLFHLGRRRADMTAVGKIIGVIVRRRIGHGRKSS